MVDEVKAVRVTTWLDGSHSITYSDIETARRDIFGPVGASQTCVELEHVENDQLKVVFTVPIMGEA